MSSRLRPRSFSHSARVFADFMGTSSFPRIESYTECEINAWGKILLLRALTVELRTIIIINNSPRIKRNGGPNPTRTAECNMRRAIKENRWLLLALVGIGATLFGGV